MTAKPFKTMIGLLTLTLLVSLSACRKDDICTQGGTPKLGIAFYDASNTDNLKEVANLYVIALPGQDTLYNNVSVSQIALTLNVNTDQCRWIFANNQNNDTLEFNYQREVVFVSKACGYKTIFKQLQIQLQPDADNWIKQIEQLTNNISTDTTHVKIYH
jgi:hypothetical protein